MTHPSDLHTDDQVIRPHVEPGETLLWTGRPDPAKWPQGWSLSLFGLAWVAAVVFIVVDRLPGSDTPWPAVLMLVPFFVIGVYLLFGRFFVNRWAKQHTRYGLTDRRAIMVGPRDRLTTVDLSTVAIMRSPSLRGDHVSVYFEGPRPLWAGRRLPTNAGVDFLRQGPPGFHDVADVTGLGRALTYVVR
ncbi:hypothetical protein FDO65_19045 [Nakamurella flava]|uniref:PH domain-containing protein n=1 Tax=Nakamurella flava TaxID=2576308 RepID=A0A4U6QAL3_9ACTN|nr:hypothetical protein [Nakamurella flava]TKV56932.1 hypothetical protein FDO65_19045 [Nakamurella flava]